MKKSFALAFTIIMLFTLVACAEDSDNQVLTKEPVVNEQVQSTEKPSVEKSAIEQSMVDAFIEEYNMTAPNPITDAVEVDVTDKESGHYRTEFRLGAFEDSIAKTGKLGDIVIDIVNCGWQKDELRLYADGITSEQAIEIVKYSAPIMDPDVPSEDLQNVLDYLSGTNDYHNRYLGNLCMTFNEIHGQLMLRTD